MKRIAWLLCVFSAGAQELSLDLRDWPIRIGPEAQLFIDEHLIAQRSGVEFRLHQPRKHASNPLIVPEKPRESYLLVYGSTLRDPVSGLFRLWYTNNTGMAYAESRDGIQFTRPKVGMDGTNQLLKGHRGRSDTLTILNDPKGGYRAYAMEYRYPDKDGVREQRREGVYLSTSSDGIHWKEREQPVLYSGWRNEADRLPGSEWDLGDVHYIAWDPKLKKYIGHIKLTDKGERTRGLSESDDGIHWSDPRLILRADPQDRPGDQLYSLIAFPYESAWIGFLGVYHKGTDERLDIQLVTSRDGRHYSRKFRQPFMANGATGEWDWGILHIGQNPPLMVDGQLRIYYGGIDMAHNVRLRDVKRFGIGLATLRPDGFVSLDAAQRGEITTRPLVWEGSALTVNAAVQQGGFLRVVLLKADGSVAMESEPLTGDAVRSEVRWKGGASLPKSGQHRLRFTMEKASLYAFRVQ